MTDSDIVHFYPSSEIFGKAAEIFDSEKEVLQKLVPTADIQHIGSCAVPDAMGKFDIDIQIRIPKEIFRNAVETLIGFYPVKHPNLWTDEFALFKNKESSDVDIDYMVTVFDTYLDSYYKLRDFLIANPDILQKYNELKLQYEGKTYEEYRKAKREFLGSYESPSFT